MFLYILSNFDNNITNNEKGGNDMNRSIGCCCILAGAGFIAGAMLASNNAEVRKWFTSTTKKLSDMYDDVMQKINSMNSQSNSSSETASSSGSEISATNESSKQKH